MTVASEPTAQPRVPLPSRLRILVRGVGGQAVPLVVRLLAKRLGERTERLETSETRGMAQRGGVVAATIDAWFDAPAALFRSVLLGLELTEGVRALGMLRPGDAAFLSTAVIVPPGAIRPGSLEGGSHPTIPSRADVSAAAAALGVRLCLLDTRADAPWPIVQAAFDQGIIPDESEI
jgi:hypothetical protein